MPNAPTVWVVDDDVDDQYLLEMAFKNFDHLFILNSCKMERTYSLPLSRHSFIILTTSSTERDRSHSYRLRADGFLTKPLSGEDTVMMLKMLASEWL